MSAGQRVEKGSSSHPGHRVPLSIAVLGYGSREDSSARAVTPGQSAAYDLR